MTEQAPLHESTSYPPAPWDRAGQQWMSLFRVGKKRALVDEPRPAGVYVASFVSNEEPSPLPYHELLVARPVTSTEHGRRVSITDIWVDSAQSLPCRGHWDFDADGPLGWLRDARQLASFRMVDFRMSFA